MSLILFCFFCNFCYSQQIDSLDIALKNNVLSVNYKKRALLIKTTKQLDSFINNNVDKLKNLTKTKIVLWIEGTNKPLRDTIYYLITKKYGIKTFANYSDLY